METSNTIFCSLANTFEDSVRKLKAKRESMLEMSLLKNNATNLERIKILVEIVSATNVPALDADNSSDPYVIVTMKDNIIHKTKYISKT